MTPFKNLFSWGHPPTPISLESRRHRRLDHGAYGVSTLTHSIENFCSYSAATQWFAVETAWREAAEKSQRLVTLDSWKSESFVQDT